MCQSVAGSQGQSRDVARDTPARSRAPLSGLSLPSCEVRPKLGSPSRSGEDAASPVPAPCFCFAYDRFKFLDLWPTARPDAGSTATPKAHSHFVWGCDARKGGGAHCRRRPVPAEYGFHDPQSSHAMASGDVRVVLTRVPAELAYLKPQPAVSKGDLVLSPAG